MFVQPTSNRADKAASLPQGAIIDLRRIWIARQLTCYNHVKFASPSRAGANLSFGREQRAAIIQSKAVLLKWRFVDTKEMVGRFSSRGQELAALSQENRLYISV